MADNPFQTMLQPGGNRTGMYEMRMMQMASRMDDGGMRRGYPRASGNPMLAGMMGMSNEPDLSQFTYDPVMRQRAIAAGVTPLEANQVQHNAILPNTGFFGNHPRLSAALEGGMFGALASHGGMTPGESIQGALEGIVGGQQMRQGMLRQQFARPFEASGIMEGLEDRKQRRDLQAADIEHLRAVNEHLKNGDEEKAKALMETNRHNEAVEAMNNTRIDATAPRNLGGGLYGYYNPLPPSGQGRYVLQGTPEQAYNPNQKGDWSIQENPEAKMGRTAAGAGPWYSIKDPKTGKVSYGRVHEGAQVPEGAQLVQGDYQEKKADKTSAARDTWVKQQMAKPGVIWTFAGVAPGDKNASEKLGKFYDENLASSVGSGDSGTQGNPIVIK